MEEHSGPPSVSHEESQRASAAGHIRVYLTEESVCCLQTAEASPATCKISCDLLFILHADATDQLLLCRGRLMAFLCMRSTCFGSQRCQIQTTPPHFCLNRLIVQTDVGFLLKSAYFFVLSVKLQTLVKSRADAKLSCCRIYTKIHWDLVDLKEFSLDFSNLGNRTLKYDGGKNRFTAAFGRVCELHMCLLHFDPNMRLLRLCSRCTLLHLKKN